MKTQKTSAIVPRVLLSATLVGTIALAGCGQAAPTTVEGDGEATQQEATTDYEVDYGSSTLYSKEDIDAAIDAVMVEFNTWEGCTMKRIAFTDDKSCTDTLTYCNEMRDKDAPEYDEAMLLTSEFHSPSEVVSRGTAFEPEKDYTDYTWTLARTNGGEWKLLTWGYE
ncbi:MAG: hypothetical protein IKG18_10670 [Atopobiaceae bacterium]|nr:hypothetical protein [Atopobiaceae bacterium]